MTEPTSGALPRGIQHLGVTVPDLEEATRFLVEGLGAQVSYDGLSADDEPRRGAEGGGGRAANSARAVAGASRA